MRTVANALVELAKDARAIFLQEPRLLKLSAPTYVLGNIYQIISLAYLSVSLRILQVTFMVTFGI